MSGIGRLLIFAGVALVVIGLLVTISDRLPFKIGRLPGDIVWRGKNSTFYFPITTIILLNLVLFLVMKLFRR